jgi:hypothetical protein
MISAPAFFIPGSRQTKEEKMTGTVTMQAVLGIVGGGIGIFCLSFILYWKLLAEPYYRQKRRAKQTVTIDQPQGLANLELQRQDCRTSGGQRDRDVICPAT